MYRSNRSPRISAIKVGQKGLKSVQNKSHSSGSQAAGVDNGGSLGETSLNVGGISGDYAWAYQIK